MTIIRLQLHRAIYRPDSFVMMLRYCANLKAIRYVINDSESWHNVTSPSTTAYHFDYLHCETKN